MRDALIYGDKDKNSAGSFVLCPFIIIIVLGSPGEPVRYQPWTFGQVNSVKLAFQLVEWALNLI